MLVLFNNDACILSVSVTLNCLHWRSLVESFMNVVSGEIKIY